MIKEDYVSLEIAKLLKEKGFNNPCLRVYDNKGIICIRYTGFDVPHNYLNRQLYLCPTHQMAMKWLREVYDLHIIAYPFKSGNDTSIKHYCCQVFKTFNLLGCERYIDETLTSYEEAVEAALKYSLENLI